MTTSPKQTSDTQEIPWVDLKVQTEQIHGEICVALEKVLQDTCFSGGPMVSQFEREFAAFSQTRECVAVNNGTSALHLAMNCLGVGPGDEVIAPSMSFIASVWPCLYLGAIPVFVDIDPERYTLDPHLLERAITSKTKAIVVVHLYGQCADMDAIMDIADAKGIPVIEDAAHAAGARYKGRPVGSIGKIGCFSFYPTKNLGAMGEGGALTTDDPDLAEQARIQRNQGQKQPYHHELLGYNYRMSGFQGAVLSVKLKHLDTWNNRRRSIASEYDRELTQAAVTLPKAFSDGGHIYHLYVIRDQHRDALKETLEAAGVKTGMHYPLPIHLQMPFQPFGYAAGDLPVTEDLARTCLSLPMYPELTQEQVRRIVKALHQARPV